jgi:transcription elongation factor Elf1/predicted transcriptional regulator
MVRPLPKKTREKVLQLWLSGASYRDVHAQLGVGLASVSRILDDFRKSAPDLDTLRETSSAVKESGFTMTDVLGCLPFLVKLRDLDVPLKELPLYIETLEKTANEVDVEPSDFIHAAMKALKWRKAGKSVDEILKEAEEKKAEIRELDKKIQDKKGELQTLKDKLKLAENLADLKCKTEKAKADFDLIMGRLKVARQDYGDLTRLQVLKANKTQRFQCPRCGNVTSVQISTLEASKLLQTGQPLTVTCRFCGHLAYYNITWILANIGLQVLA